jgi:hypothetical protein
MSKRNIALLVIISFLNAYILQPLNAGGAARPCDSIFQDETRAGAQNTIGPEISTKVPHGYLSVLLDLRGTRLKSEMGKLETSTTNYIPIVDSNVLSDKKAVDAIKKSRRQFLFFAESASNEQIGKMLDTSISDIMSIAIVPIGDKNISTTFGLDSRNLPVNQDMKNQMEKAKQDFNKMERCDIVSDETTPIREFILGRIQKLRPNQLIVITGHNEEGILTAPNGKISIGEINKELEAQNRFGIILSCETMRYPSLASNLLLTSQRIEFHDAVKAIAKIEQRLAKDGTTDIRQIAADMQSALVEDKDARNRKIIVVCCIVGSLILVAVLCVDNECS